MHVQWSSNAANKGVFQTFVLCGLVYKQMTYSSVNQLQLLLCVQLQTGLEMLKRRGRGMKFESSYYGMLRHIDRNWPAFRRNLCSEEGVPPQHRTISTWVHGVTFDKTWILV